MFENSQQALEHNFHNSQFHHLQLNWTCELSSNNSFEFELRDSVGNKHRKLVQSFIWIMKMPNMDRIAVSDSQTDWLIWLINIWSTFNCWAVFQNIKLNQIIPLWVQRSCQQVSNNQKNAEKKSSNSHFHWSIFARVNGPWRYFIFMPRVGVMGKWTELSWVFRSALTGKLLEFLKVLLEISKLYYEYPPPVEYTFYSHQIQFF